MRILKSAAIVAAGLLALAGCQKAVDVAAVTDEAKRGVRDWAAAYNAGDADTIAAKYAEDAIVMPPGTTASVGREAFRTFIAADIAGAKAAGVTLSISDGDTAGVSGDLAWHSGAYTVQDASGATVDSGNYLEVLQNFDGKWLIVRDIWNSDRPPAPAAPPAAEEAAAPAG
ncbi:MAG: YybH family protein [Gammaproteobacteria bacterium]